LHRLFLLLGAVVYIASCVLPALSFRVLQTSPPRIENYRGIAVLLLGWYGLWCRQPAWLANPLLAVSFYLLLAGRRQLAISVLLLAFLLALCTWAAKSQEFIADEGGVTKMTMVRPLLGCYLWLASILLLIGAAWSWPASELRVDVKVR
jgi:hypothetical protein